MKITYRFIDGTETIVEVANESLAKIILDMNRQEDARQHRIAYNERSIELFDELGIQLGTCDSYDIEGDVQEEIEKRRISLYVHLLVWRQLMLADQRFIESSKCQLERYVLVNIIGNQVMHCRKRMLLLLMKSVCADLTILNM